MDVNLGAEYLGWNVSNWALGVGARYPGIAVFGRDSASPEPFQHGLRLGLSIVQTPPQWQNVPRVVSAHSGFELGLELLFGPAGTGIMPFVDCFCTGWRRQVVERERTVVATEVSAAASAPQAQVDI